MPGAVVSTLGTPLGSQIVCASTPLAARIDEIQIDMGEGPSWDALRSREPVMSPDLQLNGGELWPHAWSALRALRVGGLYAFPLHVGPIGVGCLVVYSLVARVLSRAEVEGMSGLATIVSRRLLRHALDRAAEEVGEMETGPYSRREIHQASGMIAAQTGLGVDDALVLLRGHAYATERTVSEVAADVVARRIDFGA